MQLKAIILSMKLWERILVSLTFLTNACILAGSSFQGNLYAKLVDNIAILNLSSFLAASSSTTINLLDSVNQSGRHAACLDEDVVYSCSSFTDSLTWNIDRINVAPVVFVANDSSPPLQRRDKAIVILLNNTPRNLKSQLIIPYLPSWNGTTIECMSNESRRLSYVIAGKFSSRFLT